ncbi:MAG: bifunctional metallophosphatase/5'-nucleotidase [Candidatus Riflebacteria bacterium]|nr:bifunctional metallophosphatase/5'-nucleotidase [Candidatus Riflebacteria bacterium]
MKKTAIFAFIFLALFWHSSLEALTHPVEFTIIHTSDFHSHLVPFDCASGTSMGGYARLKKYKENLEASGRKVVMLSSGDVFQGTLFFRFFQGIPDAEFMKKIGFDAMVLGNHEFDASQDGIVEAFKDATFPILSANLAFNGNAALSNMVKESAVLPVTVGTETVKIGVFGLTDEKLFESAPLKLLKGVFIHDTDTSCQSQLTSLKEKGAETIIALTHLGFDRDIDLATKFPEVSGILGGHSHQFLPSPVVRNVPTGHQFVSQSGEFGRSVSRIDLRLTPTSTGIQTEVISAGLVPMSSDLPEDPEVKETAEKLWLQIADKVKTEIGETTSKLLGDKPFIRQMETTMGNVVADGMNFVLDGDIALINGGGIRSSIQAGKITIGDCLNVLPFDNFLVKLTMSGTALQHLFEQIHAGMKKTSDFGGFMHVSNGFSVHYSAENVRLFFNGLPIDPKRDYTVITNDFLALGGNGLTAFGESSTMEITEILTSDSLIKYVKKQVYFDCKIEGRIINKMIAQPSRTFPTRVKVQQPEC